MVIRVWQQEQTLLTNFNEVCSPIRPKSNSLKSICFPPLLALLTQPTAMPYIHYASKTNSSFTFQGVGLLTYRFTTITAASDVRRVKNQKIRKLQGHTTDFFSFLAEWHLIFKRKWSTPAVSSSPFGSHYFKMSQPKASKRVEVAQSRNRK